MVLCCCRAVEVRSARSDGQLSGFALVVICSFEHIWQGVHVAIRDALVLRRLGSLVPGALDTGLDGQHDVVLKIVRKHSVSALGQCAGCVSLGGTAECLVLSLTHLCLATLACVQPTRFFGVVFSFDHTIPHLDQVLNVPWLSWL